MGVSGRVGKRGGTETLRGRKRPNISSDSSIALSPLLLLLLLRSLLIAAASAAAALASRRRWPFGRCFSARCRRCFFPICVSL
ncbi:hypothetical protein LOK49_Contig650G00004 [Camellia lanceoleosa]|nr:hypothetical protein LOK49_Contig650G00004 [Camellia lanceoleosa]